MSDISPDQVIKKIWGGWNQLSVNSHQLTVNS
jgi:hypothetical protein